MKNTSIYILLSCVFCLAFATPANRVLSFVNECSADVWIQPITGATGSCPCQAGATCNTINNLCFFNTPTPSLGNWRVPVGKSSSISFPYYNWNDGDHSSFWTGNFAFCMSGTQCTASAATCDASGCAGAGPNNLVEFNLLKKNSVGGPDFYDISNIFGVNVPVSVAANGVTGSSSAPYTCGSPGSHAPTAGLGASQWSLSPPSNDYRWVSPPNPSSPTTCSTDSNCPSGQVCGLIYTPQGQIERVCGSLSGFWTPYRVCADQSSTSIFNCNNAANSNLIQCAGQYSSSCYQPGASSSCCGCANWQDVFGTSVVPSSTQRCVNSNPTWTSTVQPELQWLKSACPNCYTYPYDDMSSTFTCGNTDGNGYNNQAYTITFCPANGKGISQSPTTSGTASSTTGSATSASSSGQSTSGCGSGLSFCPNAGGTGQCYSPSQYTCNTKAPYLCPTTAPFACGGGCASASC